MKRRTTKMRVKTRILTPQKQHNASHIIRYKIFFYSVIKNQNKKLNKFFVWFSLHFREISLLRIKNKNC